jgi:hypothetical protein
MMLTKEVSRGHLSVTTMHRLGLVISLAVMVLLWVGLAAEQGAEAVKGDFLRHRLLVQEEAQVSQVAGAQTKDSNVPTVFQPRFLPLTELVRSYDSVTCPPGLVHVADTIPEDQDSLYADRQIPKIIHITSASRCMPPELALHVDQWRLPGHALVIHDDAAMHRLLDAAWPEFPHLAKYMQCITVHGAPQADLWRYLVLYAYGGIYTDIDNAPVTFTADTIAPTDEAYFVTDRLGTPSQWFMATRARHPITYLSMQEGLEHLAQEPDVGKLRVVWTTGPGAVLWGYNRFLGEKRGARVPGPGLYTGWQGATLRIAGDAADENAIVNRAGLTQAQKESFYAAMGMKHLKQMNVMRWGTPTNQSCWELLYEADQAADRNEAMPRLRRS